MQWRQIDAWKDAASALKINLIEPMEITLPSGETVCAELIVEHFGAPKGTIILSTLPSAAGTNFLLDSGYTWSLFESPDFGCEHSILDLKEILLDWNWCGPMECQPEWISK